MTPDQLSQFLTSTRDAAKTAGHVWPEYAACEAALESAWGTTQLYIKGNNVFGEKQSFSSPRFGTFDLPTHEFVHGALVEVVAHWISYPDLSTCFQDRMATLRRLAPVYVEYASALAAPDGETFVTEVSKKWSTDPLRAQKVLAIYAAHSGVF